MASGLSVPGGPESISRCVPRCAGAGAAGSDSALTLPGPSATVRAVRLIASVSLTVVLAATVAAQDPLPPELKGGEKLAAILQRVSEAQLETTTLEAAFEQRRVSRLLAEPSVMSGRFYYRAPDHVRWEYTSPQPMTVLINEAVAITYRPAEKRAERIEVGRVQRRVFRLMGAAEPLDALRQYFSFTLRDPGDGANFVLVLRPTVPQIKKRMQEVTVEIDRTRFLPVALAYVESDGDSTSYAFTDIVRNTEIADERFQLDLPPDVEVVTVKLRSGE
jgi:outer membrane lipoprotein carrier protein